MPTTDTSTMLYTRTHEWVRLDDDIITIGITQHAQDLLGDIVFIDLPTLNATVNPGDEIAVIESVKTAADIYAPIKGKITAINNALSTQPELINESPEENGWIFRIQTTDIHQLDDLLSYDAYQNNISDT